MIELAALTLVGCIAVAPSANGITVGDLNSHVSGLESALQDKQISFAPAPGVKRIFTIAELRRLGASTEHGLCFERRTSPLTAENVLQAMHRTLPAASIQVLEISRAAAPEGTLEFPVTGLHTSTSGTLWAGYVLYGRKERFYVWAKVKIPNDVNRGDTVKVQVHSGAAVLEFDAQAETSGVTGQPVSLVNPSSKKRFQAKIQGPGRALVGKTE